MRRVLLLPALLCGVLATHAQTTAARGDASPALGSRATSEEEATEVDARLIGPLLVPADASGVYAFAREHDTIELDFEAAGLSGYITVLENPGPRHAEPLTFFFATSRLDGFHVDFLTHEVHRTRYAFTGRLAEIPAGDGSLQRNYELRGTLTTRHVQPDGSTQDEQRAVAFRKFLLRR